MMNEGQIVKRKAELNKFVSEGFSVIADFAKRLGVNDAHVLLIDVDRLKQFIFTTVHEFMKSQRVEPKDRVWIITRIGYLLGEFFKEKYSGHWTVNENKNSKQYGHYVVFAKSVTSNVMYPR